MIKMDSWREIKASHWRRWWRSSGHLDGTPDDSAGATQSLPLPRNHSAVNFATLGYGDVVMSAQHKLLGPLEAINGALMIGVSTAALICIFQQVIQTTAGARRR
jgi:hypothetical protein